MERELKLILLLGTALAFAGCGSSSGSPNTGGTPGTGGAGASGGAGGMGGAGGDGGVVGATTRGGRSAARLFPVTPTPQLSVFMHGKQLVKKFQLADDELSRLTSEALGTATLADLDTAIGDYGIRDYYGEKYSELVLDDQGLCEKCAAESPAELRQSE